MLQRAMEEVVRAAVVWVKVKVAKAKSLTQGGIGRTQSDAAEVTAQPNRMLLDRIATDLAV